MFHSFPSSEDDGDPRAAAAAASQKSHSPIIRRDSGSDSDVVVVGDHPLTPPKASKRNPDDHVEQIKRSFGYKGTPPSEEDTLLSVEKCKTPDCDRSDHSCRSLWERCKKFLSGLSFSNKGKTHK